MNKWLGAVVIAPRVGPRGRAAAVVLATVAVAAIATLDHAIGPNLSLSVFYFIPVAATTLAVSVPAGIGLAALAAVAWTLADNIRVDPSRMANASNALFRFCALSFVVALLGALRRAYTEAQASERRSKDFLAFAAHQLRTPLAGLRASAEALVLTAPNDASTAQRERLASNLIAESDRIGRLVRSLLRLTRLDAGDGLDPAPCDVEVILRSEVDRAQALARRLTFRLRLPDRLVGLVLLDPAALAEIVANLLDNARRHAVTRVDVSLEMSPAVMRILVGDDGPGLPEGSEEQAFDRFVSLDGRGGSGLGLSIARSLAGAQGGTLDYRSRHFVLELPLVPHKAAPAPATADAPTAGDMSRDREPRKRPPGWGGRFRGTRPVGPLGRETRERRCRWEQHVAEDR